MKKKKTSSALSAIIIICCFSLIVQGLDIEVKFDWRNTGVIPIGLSLKATPLAIKKYTNRDNQIDFIQGYVFGYKFALIKLTPPKNYYSSIDEEKSPYAEGNRLGKIHGFGDIKKNIQRCSWIDFGYTPVKLKGRFFFNLEMSDFKTKKGKTYWVDMPDHMFKNIIVGKKMTATGYLSREGTYGHMGGYSKEFIVMHVK